MMRLLKYELKRLLLNKFFLALLLITAAFGWQTLTGSVVRGIGYTAPFSAWSCGYYWAQVAPLLSVTLLFFVTFLYSPLEKRARPVLDATKTPPGTRLRIRFAAVAIGYLLLMLVVLVMGQLFFLRFFRLSALGTLLFTMLLTLLPCFLLTLGLGAMAGRIHVSLLYLLMLLMLLISQAGLPVWLDYTGAAYYANMPPTLPIGPQGEPAFTLTASFLLSRVLLSAIGIAGIALSVSSGQRHPGAKPKVGTIRVRAAR